MAGANDLGGTLMDENISLQLALNQVVESDFEYFEPCTGLTSTNNVLSRGRWAAYSSQQYDNGADNR